MSVPVVGTLLTGPTRFGAGTARFRITVTGGVGRLAIGGAGGVGLGGEVHRQSKKSVTAMCSPRTPPSLMRGRADANGGHQCRLLSQSRGPRDALPALHAPRSAELARLKDNETSRMLTSGRTQEDSMRLSSVTTTFVYVLVSGLLLLALNSNALAEIKRANGGSCDTVGTERRDGKDQDGNKVNCLFDSCTYTECSTSGGAITNCVKKTEYSNARDCKAALTTHGGLSLPHLDNLSVLAPEEPSNPTGPKRGLLVSIKVAITKDELHQACDAASGMFSAGNKLYQCVAPNGDVVSCKVATEHCIGSLVVPKRPATLLGFATAPFGQSTGAVPDEGTPNRPTDTTPGTSTSSSSSTGIS